MPPKKILFYF